MHIIKFVTGRGCGSFDYSISDLPISRYAEVLLNFAEARAELGLLTQADLNRSINLFHDRVGIPALILGQTNANPDSFLEAQYLNVENGSNKGLIREIRRERRVELYMEYFCWDDLMRWKVGQKLTQPFRGMYFPGEGSYDLENDGDTDVVSYTDDPDSQQQGVAY